MYKPSKFNHIVENFSSLGIFNSLTGNIARISDEQVKNIVLNGSENKSDLVNSLLKDGFLVEEAANEDNVSEVKLFDLTANKDLHLILMPTLACNFRCTYCYENFCEDKESFPLKKMNSELQESIIKYVNKNLNEFWGVMLEWYGGEPLLEPDIIDNISQKVLELSHQKKKPFFATLTTNGYLLDLNMFKRMLKNRVIKFHITLDGMDYIHNKFRKLQNGDGSFEKIISNLRQIRDNVKSTTFKIIIRTNVSTELSENLEQWLKFLSDEFGNDSRFEFLIRAIEDRGATAVKGIGSSILDDYSVMYEKILNSEYQLNYSMYYGAVTNSLCIASKRNAYVIDAYGNIRKCGEFLRDENTIVGTMGNDGNMLIDRSRLAKWLVKKDLSQLKCKSCTLLPACNNNSCPMKANFVADGICNICSFEHRNIDYIIKLFTGGKRKYDFVKEY